MHKLVTSVTQRNNNNKPKYKTFPFTSLYLHKPVIIPTQCNDVLVSALI